ncbi:MAG: hypothetical protein KUA43_02455 [Hoeflea sp.]|uniref:hypothetical protein n=1 Tax=Hoeflea sp. TaxID=1940281 RepID=UPI001D2727EC|nr:hypothetical protein [Hoeflea sp.]MBU4530730.1 hypothetical protein [Alphaproteobacteria bacterium]MBU4544950.1 hypothetical protein [Alphaproteobacteria bacterium]MBU4552093.1 hypothetical protein [Alphaproteobacteria bacterium]MBV1722282.1 hypothetical protein [Hoeflea sp.]MBV1761844.1 hypothetical protein [Hoeflea sp.]
MSALIERTTAAIKVLQAAFQGDYRDIEAIADEAADMRAATPQEALLQACILVGEIDRDGEFERMEKLAESLVDFLERTAGIDRRDFGFEFYTGPSKAA